MDEHAFPPTEFAVAWLGCSLHLVTAVGWLSMLFHRRGLLWLGLAVFGGIGGMVVKHAFPRRGLLWLGSAVRYTIF